METVLCCADSCGVHWKKLMEEFESEKCGVRDRKANF